MRGKRMYVSECVISQPGQITLHTYTSALTYMHPSESYAKASKHISDNTQIPFIQTKPREKTPFSQLQNRSQANMQKHRNKLLRASL
jgi:hypothetical protein